MKWRKFAVYSTILAVSLAYSLFFLKIFHYSQEMEYLKHSFESCEGNMDTSTHGSRQNLISLAGLEMTQFE
jgi:hypothetical protein